MGTDFNECAARFKVLSDPTRLRVIEILSCGELCACDILESFEITQPTLSHHMKSLTDSGLVISEKRGSWVYYRLDVKAFDTISSFIGEISHGDDSCICHESAFECNCDPVRMDGSTEKIEDENE